MSENMIDMLFNEEEEDINHKVEIYKSLNQNNINIQPEKNSSMRVDINELKNTLNIENNIQNIISNTITRDYYNEFKELSIQKTIEDFLNYKIKDYISVTKLICCPMQNWLVTTERVNVNYIEKDKIFIPLILYGSMGSFLHDKIYQILNLQENTENRLRDDEEKISGKYDILNNKTLIDIKTTVNKYAEYKDQMSLYYHLCNYNNIELDKIDIWFVLQNKVVTYDLDDLKPLIQVYLSWNKDLRNSLKNDTPPKIYDLKQCKYCLIEKFCKSKILHLI